MHFPNPIYDFVDLAQKIGCVTVVMECTSIGYVFVGGKATTLKESCKKAAEQAVRRLMKLYHVRVEDFNSDKKQMFERCAHLYYLKHVELERIEKKQPHVVLHKY